MGVKDKGNGSPGFLGMVVATFKSAVWAGKHHLGHGNPKPASCHFRSAPTKALLTLPADRPLILMAHIV
jgi:hypothetical protein